MTEQSHRFAPALPEKRELYYGGEWRAPVGGSYEPVTSPGSGASLGTVAWASAADIDAAVKAARKGFLEWRDVVPLERARILKAMAAIVRKHASELTWIDAIDGGAPIAPMSLDVESSAQQLEFFAGLVTEMKGASIPMGPDVLNVSVREPMGVVGKIIPFNHPFMCCAAKSAAPLAAGNSVVVKPPEQASLSALRFAELVGDLLPPGVLNIVPGGREAGAALASHPQVAMVSVIGSVQTGRAVMAAASNPIKPVILELGGKNALIAFPDADPDEVAAAAVAGMNFSWCGQSCGSTSRAMLHADIHDKVVRRIVELLRDVRPGDPTNPATAMGAIISRTQMDRVLEYIGIGLEDGAELALGGKRPDDPALAGGNFVEPTVFTGVTSSMRIANEEIFGPVLSVMSWTDEKEMLRTVNSVDYGLTCSIWTNDLHRAQRTARAVEVGFVWVNEVGKHFLGAPFGGYKQSGIGREECLSELLAYTQEKNLHIRFKNLEA